MLIYGTGSFGGHWDGYRWTWTTVQFCDWLFVDGFTHLLSFFFLFLLYSYVHTMFGSFLPPAPSLTPRTLP
jgi:hypothetical protein